MIRWSRNSSQLVRLSCRPSMSSRIVHGRACWASCSSFAAAQQYPTGSGAFSSAREDSRLDSAGTAAPVQATPPKRRRRRNVRNSITTLDPRCLDDRSFLDVSAKGFPRIYLERSQHDTRSQCLLKLAYRFVGGDRIPFPPDTKGYLYFHADPYHPLASEIRFRITNNANPTSFAAGHDLTLPDGSVWCRHLLRIASDPSKALIRHLLIRDGLVTEEQFSNYQEVPVPTGVHVSQPITRLGQLFVLDFVKHVNQKVTVHSPSRDKPRDSYMYLPLRYEPSYKPRKGFYKDGAAICRFERSTLPEHAGKRMVVMRYVKILRPVELAPWSTELRGVHAIAPIEGELCTRNGRVWAKDVDAETQEAQTFRDLYEADEQESKQS